MAIGIDDFWSSLRDKIEQEIEDQSEPIADGKCTNIEHYRTITGFIRGLKWVLASAREQAEGSQEEEDEDAGIEADT